MQYCKKFIQTAVAVLALGSLVAYADEAPSHENHAHSSSEHKHESHGHTHRYAALKNEASRETIEKAAKQKVQSLVAEKKIHESWATVPISKIGKTHYGDTDDWVVGFDNLQMKNKKRRTLYIFVSVHGEIRGANYTGN